MLSLILNNLVILILVLFIVLIGVFYFYKKRRSAEIKKNLDQTEGPPDDIYPLF